MATSKINFTVTDGSLFTAIAGEDHVSSLLFDVTTTPDGGGAISANGEVHQIFSVKQAEDLGIDDTYEEAYPHKHISDFFAVNPNGELYVGLSDCSTDFTHLSTMQNIAQGRLRQQGVFTKQELFTAGYAVNFVSAIDAIAEADAVLNAPYSVILHANVATVDSGATDTAMVSIPTAIGGSNRVSVTIGQSNDAATKAIQTAGTGNASVGLVGALIGSLSLANVHESIGWVAKFDIASVATTIAFGFGDFVSGSGADNTPYDSVAAAQLDTLDNYGYIYPLKYTGRAGSYFSSNQALSTGDYNSILRNRTIDKSRRAVRAALLPTIQQPLYVDPNTGGVSAGTIGQFRSIVHTQLSAMLANGEISGFTIIIDPLQDVLGNNGMKIGYRIIPATDNKQIDVELGFARQA
jgi:hypothetical protein